MLFEPQRGKKSLTHEYFKVLDASLFGNCDWIDSMVKNKTNHQSLTLDHVIIAWRENSSYGHVALCSTFFFLLKPIIRPIAYKETLMYDTQFLNWKGLLLGIPTCQVWAYVTVWKRVSSSHTHTHV